MKRVCDMNAHIKANARVQDLYGNWATTKCRVPCKVIGERYGVYKVKVGSRILNVDYKYLERGGNQNENANDL